MHGGHIISSGTVTIATEPLASLATSAVATLLFCGGDDDAVLNASASPVLQEWIHQAARQCRRVGSICSGALALARLGLLDGKRATAHWSAGITTGIDMTLQMVADDVGESAANAVAKRLVIAARRPGYLALDVAAMAARVSMSPRTFHRKFTHRFQQTPASFVETMRLKQGRTLLLGGLAMKFIVGSAATAISRNLPRHSSGALV